MEPNPYESPRTINLPPARPVRQDPLRAHIAVGVAGLLVSVPMFQMAFGINRDEGGPKAIVVAIPFVITVVAAVVNLVLGVYRLLVGAARST